VTLRSNGLVVTACVVSGMLGLFFLAGSAADGSAGARAIIAVIGLVAIASCIRLTRAGLQLDAATVTIRGLTTTEVLTRAEVAGLAVQRVLGGRLQRAVVVCTNGRVVPAVWTVASSPDPEWSRRLAWAAAGFGPTQPLVSGALSVADRLVPPPAPGSFAQVPVLPIASADPGLTPATVTPVDPPTRWLGWETIFVVAAFALPGVASAVDILARHLGGVSDLNEFDLPLPHSPAASLFILLLAYSTSALVVPIALLLLARTGQPPRVLGLERGRRLGWDAVGAVGLLGGVWVCNLLLILPLSHFLDNKHITNSSSNSHVPAYFIVYALFVSAVTAINEEVVVNGYFLTRLSQRGWTPRSALILSLAVRTSYHAYYGVGLLATIPFGYLVTRSFQKRQRLARPILAHFMYDAILLTIAVLTS
jgi:membrane protease YdiL (CAAX protease family)